MVACATARRLRTTTARSAAALIVWSSFRPVLPLMLVVVVTHLYFPFEVSGSLGWQLLAFAAIFSG